MVEQRRIAAGARNVEGVQDSVFEDVRRIELNASEEFGAFAADVAHFHGQVLCNFTLNLEVEVLNIAGDAVQQRDALGSIRQRDRLKRLHDDRLRHGEVGHRDVIRPRINHALSRGTVEDARHIADDRLDRIKRARPADKAHAISGAQHSLVLSPPGQRPAHADRGSKVVPVVSVRLFARVG